MKCIEAENIFSGRASPDDARELVAHTFKENLHFSLTIEGSKEIAALIEPIWTGAQNDHFRSNDQKR